MPGFGSAERRILGYFRPAMTIEYDGRPLTVREVGKPVCPRGEPKTDVYVYAADIYGGAEIKISYKKENADFLENKITASRAEQLFGPDWRDMIAQSTYGILSQFLARPLIFKRGVRRTRAGSITLGWKFELVNKPGGDLSGLMLLTPPQVYDVYAGTNLSCEKRNAYVNGRVILDSGVANHILVTDNVSSAQDIIDLMLPIEDYINIYPEIYFACKALNYRTFTGGYDGNRSLAVQVIWSVENGTLVPELNFGTPLEMNGDEMAQRLEACLKYLNISTTDDIDFYNADMGYVYE